MRVLVTGGSGMLGKILIRVLSAQHETIGISKHGKFDTRPCDLTSQSEVEALFNTDHFDLVIHTAAYSDVDGCERDPKLAHESNALATKYLVSCCDQNRTPFIYVSTDYVFDGKKRSLYLETDKTFPVNVYGMTKLEGEHFANNAKVSAIVRTSWLFGPDNPNNFVNAIVRRLYSDEIVKVLADQTDSPTYVKDLAAALQTIGEHLHRISRENAKKDIHLIYQICNSGYTTRYEMTQKIKDILKLKNVQIEKLARMPVENRPALRPSFVAMSTQRYEKEFKTKLRPWQDSLKDYLSEYCK